MLININDTEYEVRFGIAFVRELDKKYNMSYIAGQKMGYGIEAVIPLVLSGSATALSEVLYTGTVTEKKRPSMDDVDAYIDEHEDYDGLIAEVIDELKKQNATKKKVAELEENYNKGLEAKKAQENPVPVQTGPRMPATK